MSRVINVKHAMRTCAPVRPKSEVRDIPDIRCTCSMGEFEPQQRAGSELCKVGASNLDSAPRGMLRCISMKVCWDSCAAELLVGLFLVVVFQARFTIRVNANFCTEREKEGNYWNNGGNCQANIACHNSRNHAH